MIQPILNMLVDQLGDYIRQVSSNVDEPPVVLGNIGMSEGLGGNEGYMQGRIVLSLVNIMEETTLKNTSPYNKFNSRHELTNPPAFLNLFLLFTANFTSRGNVTDDTDYSNGLTRLSQLIEFFQSKHVFTVQNSPAPNTIHDPDLQDVRVSLELYSMTFEQVNHLWGSLGGKQVPFVMYKAGILPVKREYTTERGEYIQDIQSDTIHIRK
ncbi:MAG: hypothetical protein AMK70_02065 [Nitrospira bacterium SG8_35_1]|nr:MAG: hypothetical protein AMK70_02065 [Nitrospira bacterium SG8_35_1]